MGKPATIGQSVQINGELTGQEDLIIDGKIDGKIVVKDHQPGRSAPTDTSTPRSTPSRCRSTVR